MTGSFDEVGALPFKNYLAISSQALQQVCLSDALVAVGEKPGALTREKS